MIGAVTAGWCSIQASARSPGACQSSEAKWRVAVALPAADASSLAAQAPLKLLPGRKRLRSATLLETAS